MSRKLVSKFIASHRGNAAVEFAIVVPLLAGIVVTVADVANIGTGVGEMNIAVRAAIQYAMNGGTDMMVAKNQALNAWQNEPSGGTMTVVQSCTCSGASHSCSTTCSDGSSPYVFVTATAKATFHGSMVTQSKTVTEKLRQK
jgi:Flp pilus assembly protein TadG